MFTLICGPSCAGKSTFLTTVVRNERAPKAPEVLFPDQILSGMIPPSDGYVHYNLMRPIQFVPGQAQCPTVGMNDAWTYDIDPAWGAINSLPGARRAIVIVASAADLRVRSSSREHLEPDLRSLKADYPRAHWRQVYEVANLLLIYGMFIAELHRRGIPFTCYAARDAGFFEIDEGEIHAFVRRDKVTRYTPAQISEMIRPAIFEYQQVRLPYGLVTRGQDRVLTEALVLPANLHGASVLDVGSALGGFCFEAERRGACRIVGLEPRRSRFEAAVILKEILNSDVEMRCESLDEFVPDEPFDYVLLLNVLHHLKEPVRALRRCAELARRALVLEFPHFGDPIFAKVFDGPPPEALNALPIIGVSTQGVDQTFIFTVPALERILTEHEQLFARLEVVESPMPNRTIVRCFK